VRIFLAIILLSSITKAEQPVDRSNHENVAPKARDSINAVATACREMNNHEGACAVVQDIQNIGNDAIEAIKEYVNVGPFEYALLTLVNVGVSQRLRIRSQLPFRKDITQTIDIKKDSYLVSWEKRF
jgi:hypothetical protein